MRLYDDYLDLGSVDVTNYADEIAEACLEYFSDFGKVHSLWTLSLPKNESIIGVTQFNTLSRINLFLGESLERVYFPITKSEWIREYPQI